MGSIYDDLPGHEGYASSMAAGEGRPTPSVPAAYVAACSCGWAGASHPPTDEGHEAALDEWDQRHAGPLLAEAVPATVMEAIVAAQWAVADLTRERPVAGTKALRAMASWAEATQQRVAGPATDRSAPGPRRRPRRL